MLGDQNDLLAISTQDAVIPDRIITFDEKRWLERMRQEKERKKRDAEALAEGPSAAPAPAPSVIEAQAPSPPKPEMMKRAMSVKDTQIAARRASLFAIGSKGPRGSGIGNSLFPPPKVIEEKYEPGDLGAAIAANKAKPVAAAPPPQWRRLSNTAEPEPPTPVSPAPPEGRKGKGPHASRVARIVPGFEASPAFQGSRPGYSFRAGDQGVGYYPDRPSADDPLRRHSEKVLGAAADALRAASSADAAPEDEYGDDFEAEESLGTASPPLGATPSASASASRGPSDSTQPAEPPSPKEPPPPAGPPPDEYEDDFEE